MNGVKRQRTGHKRFSWGFRLALSLLILITLALVGVIIWLAKTQDLDKLSTKLGILASIVTILIALPTCFFTIVKWPESDSPNERASSLVSPGGIHAKRIEADNVVSGVQIQGGDAPIASSLIQLAQSIRQGKISAQEIKARNLVSGLQYIANPAQASVDDLRRELLALRTQLEQAIASHEFSDPADAEDARQSLATAETELAKPHPDGNLVLRKLDELRQIITRSAETADAAGKLGALVIRLAPLAATLWQVAQHLFGG